MNTYAQNLVAATLALVLLSLLLALALSKENLARLRSAVAWLLKVTFFDFVEMVIFIRPWKAYVEQVGIVIWLILVYVVARYLILVQPKVTDIPGMFIPAIGYVYLISALAIVKSVLGVVRREI